MTDWLYFYRSLCISSPCEFMSRCTCDWLTHCLGLFGAPSLCLPTVCLSPHFSTQTFRETDELICFYVANLKWKDRNYYWITSSKFCWKWLSSLRRLCNGMSLRVSDLEVNWFSSGFMFPLTAFNLKHKSKFDVDIENWGCFYTQTFHFSFQG